MLKYFKYICLKSRPDSGLGLSKSLSSLLLSSLELSETNLELSENKVYEPSIRALLGTAVHFCKLGVFKLFETDSGAAGPGTLADMISARN